MCVRLLALCLFAIGLCISSGCQHKCCFRRSNPCPPGARQPVPQPLPGTTPVPFPNGMSVQPQEPVTPGEVPGNSTPLPPPPDKRFRPSVPETPGPANRIPPGVDLGTPERPGTDGPNPADPRTKPLLESPPVPDQRLPLPPRPPEDLFSDPNSKSKEPDPLFGTEKSPQQKKNEEDEFPPAAKKPPESSEMPFGIANYSVVRKGVSSGLRPALDGGLNWLQREGFKTVVHVHGPDVNEEADRKQVEKRGMTYVGITVSPETLSKEIVDTFSTVITDKSRHPVFVYDQDGSLAGGLWYLHFRLTERIPDEEARIRAGSAGLRRSRGDAHREMWIAVQKFLRDQVERNR